MRTAIALMSLLISLSLSAADWQKDLDKLVRAEDPKKQEALIQKIVEAGPDWQEVAAGIQAIEFKDKKKGKAFLRKTVCTDGIERPWVLYVPSSYVPERPTPLLMRLHGGVSAKDLPKDPLGRAEKNDFNALAEKHGWLVIHPFGQADGSTM
ncbi:hypothetical protein ACFLU6_12650 [Acidobacteriota bacterium]